MALQQTQASPAPWTTDLRKWFAWRLQRVLPDPGVSFQRIELDEALLHQVAWRRGERVLDVGCYRGDYCRALRGRGCKVVGMDVNEPSMLEDAQGDTPRVCGDGQRLPFEDGSFDTVLCHMTANLFAEPARAAAEFVRCCAPGGRIVLSVSNLRAPYQRVNRLLESCSPRCSWATLRTSANHWGPERWLDALSARGAEAEAVYSCNLCWPLVHRVRGRWIIPNRLMWLWSRSVRRFTGLPLRTGRPHFAAHDYLLCTRKPLPSAKIRG